MQRLWDVVRICVAAALAACVDGSAGRAPDVAERSSAELKTAAPAAPCTTFAGKWETDATKFARAVAPAARADFETRGDGVTPVPIGTVIIPRDEYLACCGFLLDFIGPPGELIWVGNSTSGRSVKAHCHEETCRDDITGRRPGAGVRVTFVPPATAAGFEFPGPDTAVMFDAQNRQIATMTTGPGTAFIGYESDVPIDHAEFTDLSGEVINQLFYHRCL